MQVLFMRRDLDEVLASQARMLEHRGMRAARTATSPPSRVRRAPRRDGAPAPRGRCLRAHDVSYARLLEAPGVELEGVARFLGRDLDIVAMRACIDRSR